MRERPILFSSARVRDILDGRQTQTRRVVNPQPQRDGGKGLVPIEPYRTSLGQWNWVIAATGHGTGDPFDCPYGIPTDRLWVRETWQFHAQAQGAARDEDGPFVYAADGETHHRFVPRWIPGIHMFRYASRITLEIEDVRVQRLQEISKADCVAEGMGGLEDVHAGWHQSYAQLWDSLNAKRAPWASNPWVWAITFRRAQP